MALPIKPKDTQDSCNPVSSNCVIWQGPDIPCINLCNGDSISDVVAKMAERLCTISEQLDISLLDLSCFNPIFPTPQDFQDVMQLILNKICALENPTLDPTASTGDCPDDCIITIAPCFQERDFLGNLIITLPLKDYVIKIGNDLCGLIATVNSQGTAITDLETRVTFIEDNCCDAGGGITDITTTGCVGNGVTQPIQNFLSQFEQAFCALQEITAGADLTDAQDTIQNLCVTGAENQLTPLISNPTATIPLSSLTGWYPAISNTSQALNNLYLAFCDLRTYVETVLPALVESVSQCCGVTCADLIWSMTASGISGQKFILVNPSGPPIPSGFTYCASPASLISIDHMASTVPAEFFSTVGTNDIIAAINSGTFINSPQGINIGDAVPTSADSVWYNVCVDLCLTDGTLTCNSRRCFEFYNSNICSRLGVNVSASADPSNYVSGYIQVNFGVLTLASTTYTIQLFTGAGAPYGSPVTVATGGWISTAIPGGTPYYVTVTACQTSGGVQRCAEPCQSPFVFVPVTPPPPLP
jgi:hypothetical protein